MDVADSLDGAGNFWHNRQMVFGDVSKYMQQCCPGLMTSIEIEDPAQLQGPLPSEEATTIRF